MQHARPSTEGTARHSYSLARRLATSAGTCCGLVFAPQAIILAGYNPSLHLLGVSTVAGNQTLEKVDCGFSTQSLQSLRLACPPTHTPAVACTVLQVTQNALDVLDYAGLSHIPVVAGQAKPLLRPAPLLCPEIHGGSGLDGPQGGPLLPRSTRQAVQVHVHTHTLSVPALSCPVLPCPVLTDTGEFPVCVNSRARCVASPDQGACSLLPCRVKHVR